MSSDKYIVMFDVDLDKPKARNAIVSAARPGEMPIVKIGSFSDRHTLLDEAYAEALTRKAKTVKAAKSPKDTKAKKQSGPTGPVEDAGGDNADATDEVAEETATAEEAPQELPDLTLEAAQMPPDTLVMEATESTEETDHE